MTEAAAWPLLPDPRTPAIPVSVVTRSESGRELPAGFSGRGIVRPFRRNGRNDFASATELELIASNVGQVLGTICTSDSSAGEVPWRTEFGSVLQLLRLRNNSQTLADQARIFVGRALARWEPRARVKRVRVDRDGNKLFIKVLWDPVFQNVTQSRLVVPGLETTVALG